MTTWNYLKQVITAKSLSPQYSESDECYFIKAFDGSILLGECVIIKCLHLEDLADFETNFKAKSNKPSTVILNSMAAKTLPDGKKLFKRVVGIRESIATGENIILWTCPFDWVKFIGVEITGCNHGDYVDLFVLDKAVNPIYGVPNDVLNQFGHTANLFEGGYTHKSEFDADLYKDLQLKLVFNSINTKTVPLGINFVMNEVK